MLCKKYDELKTGNDIRYPQKSDFSPEQVMAIKSLLGPWPRALEKAGIKPADEQKEELRKQKRIEHKRKITQMKIEKNS